MDEFQLIARYFAPLAAAETGALGLGDDAAVLRLPPGRDLVVTTDMLIEGVHFRADDPPDSVGVKVLAVNLSDLAAMGAEPRSYLLALALPGRWLEHTRAGWLRAFTGGLAEMQAAYAVTLAGGDTVATAGPLCVSITAIGLARPDGVLHRSGARPDDDVWVSGTIGDGALGLLVLGGTLKLGQPSLDAALVERYRRPSPRLALGGALAGHASACADISDGLVADLGHICERSSVDAVVEVDLLPLSPPARTAIGRAPELWGRVLGGGDDYELVFTASAAHAGAIQQAAARTGTPVTRIGRISALEHKAAIPQVVVRGADGQPVKAGEAGWRHFQGK